MQVVPRAGVQIETMQVLAIGVDLCNLNRLARAKDSFLQRIFSPTELAFALQQPCPSTYLALGWAAKEALIKALGKSIFSFNLNDIEVDTVAHCYQLGPLVQQYIRQQGVKQINLVLSTKQNLAIAYVILLTGG